MRKLLLLAAVAALFIVALPVATAGAASPFADVEIDVVTDFSDAPTNGPFTAEGTAVDVGLVCESGWTVDAFVRSSPREGSLNGGNHQAFKVFLCGIDHLPDEGEFVESGFVLKLQVRVDKKGDNFSWVVVDAWGDSEGLKGNGDGFGIYDDELPIVYDHFSGKIR
jgi:hypothetical protein